MVQQDSYNDDCGQVYTPKPYYSSYFQRLAAGVDMCSKCNELRYLTPTWKRYYEDGINAAGEKVEKPDLRPLIEKAKSLSPHHFEVVAYFDGRDDISPTDIGFSRASVSHLETYQGNVRWRVNDEMFRNEHALRQNEDVGIYEEFIMNVIRNHRNIVMSIAIIKPTVVIGYSIDCDIQDISRLQSFSHFYQNSVGVDAPYILITK